METQTQTRTNQQIISDSFEEFSRGNITAIIDVCDDNIIWKTYDNPIIKPAGTYKGKDGVADFFSTLGSEIEYFNFEAHEFITQGENVVVTGHHAGTVKRTGKSFDHDWCMVFKLRNGKIYQYSVYVDTYDQAKAFE